MASLKQQVTKARAAYDKAVDAIYSFAPNNTTKFSDCLALASDTARANLETARHRLTMLELDAISAGKAWRSTFGSLVWYR